MESWIMLVVSFAAAVSGLLTLTVMVVTTLKTIAYKPILANIKSLSLERERLGIMVILAGAESAPVPDSVRPSIKVTYLYRFNENDYEGHRLSIRDGIAFDNNWDKKLFTYLEKAKSTDKKISIWVNPRNPAYSIVSRKPYALRMMLYAVFFMAGTYGAYYFSKILGAWSILSATFIALWLVWLQYYSRKRTQTG